MSNTNNNTRETHHLASLALEGANIGVFKINMQNDEIEYTRTFSWLLTGDADSPFIRADFTNSIRPQDKSLRQAAYSEMLRTGKFHYEPTVIWKDGTEHKLRADGSCTFDTSGRPLIFSGIVQEITKEKDNNRLRHDWDTRFSNIIEQAPLAMSLLRGSNLLIEVINNHMLDILEQEHSIIGKSIKEVIPELTDQGYIEMMLKVLETGKPVRGTEMPVRLMRKEVEELLYFNFVFAPFRNYEGQIDGVIITYTEVTNQVKSRVALERSESRFRTLIEEAPVGTCLFVGPEMKIEVANDIMIGYWGKDREVIGKTLRDAVPELVGQRFLDVLDKVFTTGVTHEERSAPADLEINGALNTYYFDFTYKPLFNESGQVYAIMNMALDVTERVIATRKLEESELFSRNIIYNSPVAKLVFTGEDLVITTVNENMLNLLGRDDSIIGKKFSEVMPELHTSTVPERLRKVMATGETFYQPEEKIDIIRFGQPYTGYYNYIYKPLHDTLGNNYGVIVTATEVTDQVKARQKIEEADSSLRGAVELANLGTWEVSFDDLEFTFSERLKDWFGFEPDEEANARNIMEAIVEADRPLLIAAYHHAIANNTDNIYDVEYTVIPKKTGRKRILHSMGRAFFNESGEPFKISGTVQDVTTQRTIQLALEQEVQERTEELQALNEELMVTNEELAQLNENLIYSNDELQQFAHVASHDLKEPLRKIKTFIDRIETDTENTLSEKSRIFIEKVNNATNRLFSMIEGVLNYSTINATEQQLQAVDLNVIIKDIMVDLEVLITNKNAVIKTDVLPVIEGASILLYQLFYNLISNSLKFSRSEIQPFISISSKTFYKNNVPFTEIELKDNGIGFGQSEAEKIFNTFTRLNSKDQFEGTGLGLSLCKKIVLRHGGSIHAKGKKNEGAVFTLTLPIKQYPPSTDSN